METPRILLATGKDEVANRYYREAVIAAGGVPTLAYAPALDLSYDGLLLCGGVDVDPRHYGQEPNGAEAPDPTRDEAELTLTRAYIAYGKPVFGICRGAQLLNVALGGTLWQHLPTTANHRAAQGVYPVHPAMAEEGSLLWDLYDRDFSVNTHHHQALHKPGSGVHFTAYAPDGVVEGFEHISLPLFGVQWHPERILNGEGGTAPGLPLFRYFLCLCREKNGYLHPTAGQSPDVRFACGIIGTEED